VILMALVLSSCTSVTEQSPDVTSAPLTQPAEAELDSQSEEVDSGTAVSDEPVEMADTEPSPSVTESVESSPVPVAGEDESPTPTPSSTTAAPTEAQPSVEPDPVPSEAEPTGYTMAMVAANNSGSSCWSVIRNEVYDLTSWIGSHPGGSNAILGICGKEATSTFDARHSGQGAPESALKSYLLGPLAG